MRKIILFNFIICLLVMLSATAYKVNAPMLIVAQECEPIKIVKLVEPEIVEEVQVAKQVEDKWSPEDKYLLARIAMAEAEGCSLETKQLIIRTVLNRVESNKFPNTIKEVIFQKVKDTYQFSPIGDGRWNRVEPNEDCWKALDLVMTSEDYSQGALFFESCQNADNWHSRNLIFLYNSNGMRFYK